MHALDQGDATVAIGAHIVGAVAAPSDIVEHEDGGRGVKHLRRNPRVARRPRRREFIEAHDAMDGDIAAKAHDGAALSIRHEIIFIGDAAEQGLDVYPAAPDRKGPYDRLGIGCAQGHAGSTFSQGQAQTIAARGGWPEAVFENAISPTVDGQRASLAS